MSFISEVIIGKFQELQNYVGEKGEDVNSWNVKKQIKKEKHKKSGVHVRISIEKEK